MSSFIDTLVTYSEVIVIRIINKINIGIVCPISCCAYLLQWIIGLLIGICKNEWNNINTTILMSRLIIHCSRYEMGQTIQVNLYMGIIIIVVINKGF